MAEMNTDETREWDILRCEGARFGELYYSKVIAVLMSVLAMEMTKKNPLTPTWRQCNENKARKGAKMDTFEQAWRAGCKCHTHLRSEIVDAESDGEALTSTNLLSPSGCMG